MLKIRSIVYTVTVFLLLTLPSKSNACDICGCGMGSSYIGVLPEFNDHIIGVRYHYQSLRSHLGAGGVTTYLTTDETYRTLDLWGGFNLSDRFRIFVSIPFNSSRAVSQEHTTDESALGDVSLVGYYSILNQRDVVQEDNLLVQSLWIGVGIKAPTGKYERPIDASLESNTTSYFQSGTNSTDFTVNGMYDVRLQDAGISTSLQYKINTVNTYGYRYGNKLSMNLQGYYKFKIAELFTVAPNAGILYESAANDSEDDFEIDMSGGRVVLSTLGAEFTTYNIAFGGTWQFPFSQNLASGRISANSRFMTHFSVKL